MLHESLHRSLWRPLPARSAGRLPLVHTCPRARAPRACMCSGLCPSGLPCAQAASHACLSPIDGLHAHTCDDAALEPWWAPMHACARARASSMAARASHQPAPTIGLTPTHDHRASEMPAMPALHLSTSPPKHAPARPTRLLPPMHTCSWVSCPSGPAALRTQNRDFVPLQEETNRLGVSNIAVH